MRRTLQTAYCLFNLHPNFYEMKFILVPSAMEMMKHPDSISKEDQFNLNYYRHLFPTGLNTTFMTDLWQLEHLSKKEEIKAQLTLENDRQYQDVLYDIMKTRKTNQLDPIESIQDMAYRVSLLKKTLAKIALETEEDK